MDFEYSIKRNKRSKRVKIAVIADGRVVVSAPPRFDEERLSAILNKHAQWIERAVLKCKKRIDGIKIEKETFDHVKFVATAKASVMEKHASIALSHNIRLGKVTVKKMRSRWGSCSPDGNISINLLLGHLPDRLLEYVAVHEVCHLVHHNHSKHFWSLVASHLPDHRERKRELHRYSHLLASSDPM